MKSLKVIIVLIIVFSFFGVSMVNADNIDLDGTARENISVERIIDNGVEVVVYTHLDRFIQKVHESFPEISNREIAAYISDYTGQFFPLNSDEDVSFVLSLDNIHTVHEEVGENWQVLESLQGETANPEDTWYSNDGKIMIITSFSYKYTNSNGSYYEVWSTASWRNMPGVCYQDVFALGTSASFDSSYSETGSCNQTYRCDETACGESSAYYRGVSSNSTSNSGLYMQYTSGLPYLRFNVIGGACKSCYSDNTHMIAYSAFLKYRVISNGTSIIYANYGHKTTSFGGLSVSIGFDGTVSIGTNGGASVTEYEARGVTLSH